MSGSTTPDVRRLLATATASLAVALPGAADAQELGYRGSLQYATGSYVFAERTHTVYLGSALALRAGPLRLDGSVPVILQNSAVVSYVAGTPMPTGGPDHAAVRRREPGTTIPTRGGGRRAHHPGSGSRAVLPAQAAVGASQEADSVEFDDELGVHVGDPYLSGSVEAYEGFGTVRSFRLSGGTKVPVADVDSGVGTGEWDYSAGASVLLGLGEVYLFGDVTWWWLGDLPELPLDDGPSFGLGAGRAVLDGRGSVLVTLSGARSAIATVDAPLSTGVSVGYTLREGRSLSAGLSAGLTESSPDLSVFLGWSLGP